jgi:hypothetical protein
LFTASRFPYGCRKDERRFDVEGAYNIRYEIMKNALIKCMWKEQMNGLPNRVKLRSYIQIHGKHRNTMNTSVTLQSKNLLKPGIEYLDLEELQGVRGLKALRAEINLEESV